MLEFSGEFRPPKKSQKEKVKQKIGYFFKVMGIEKKSESYHIFDKNIPKKILTTTNITKPAIFL